MKERPITFSTDMVRAILDGRKSQTRRVIKPQPIEGGSIDRLMRVGDYLWGWQYLDCNGDVIGQTRCPYGRPGNRLWVRETWAAYEMRGSAGGKKCKEYPNILYKADNGTRLIVDEKVWPYVTDELKWRSPIHMPRWASRIALQITNVRVERVQDISEDEAFAAGVQAPRTGPSEWGEPPEAVYEFMRLWDHINAVRGYSWWSNPWVWVIEFERVDV